VDGVSALAEVAAYLAGPARAMDPGREAVTRRLVADTLAVGAAGRSAPFAAEAEAAARDWGTGGVGFVEAFRIHCLEWDAVHEGAVVHALSAVTGAVVAQLGRAPVPIGQALAAIAAGVEVACLLGVAATGPLRFFRPATAGAVGAAAAVGLLLGLDEQRLAHALALGVAQAAGTMQAHVEGSIALPLQVGFAARAGLSAADLAAQGLAGPAGALDGPFGYFPLFDSGSLAPHLAGLGQRIHDVSIKPWPCGRASHGVLDAIARIQAARPGLAILGIEAEVPPLVRRLVDRPWQGGMAVSHARLCLSFLAALMLRDGRIDPRAFTAENFADPALQALGSRLTLVDDGNPDPNALAPQQVRLRLEDGSTEEIALAAVLGSPAAPLSAIQQDEKRALALDLAGLAPDTDPLTLLPGWPA
jgi:2-methylcitrate dehydratase PrpD